MKRYFSLCLVALFTVACAGDADEGPAPAVTVDSVAEPPRDSVVMGTRDFSGGEINDSIEGPQIRVTLNDGRVEATPDTVTERQVTFVVTNAGTQRQQLEIRSAHSTYRTLSVAPGGGTLTMTVMLNREPYALFVPRPDGTRGAVDSLIVR